MAVGAPLASTFLLDEGGEGFVELRVVLHIETLMGELVKDQRGQSLIPPAHHRTDDRVVEPAKCRIGLDAANRHVHALQALQSRCTAGCALAVVTAISNTTGDGEAVVYGLEGKFRCGEDIPDDEGTPNVRVQAVALVIRQVQLLAGEGSGLLRLLQVCAQFLIARRVGNHAGNRLPGPQQLQLAAGQLAVIAGAGAAVEQQKQQARKQNAKNAIK
ncbi:hypothetical protein D9M69_447750 [compost metagenome]